MKLARAQQASAALGYRQTVLTALQDVENALVSYRSDQQQVEGLDDTVAALQRAFTLASDSYRQGISTFIEALDAQRQLAQAQQQAEQARVQSTLDLVALYKALGGGLGSVSKREHAGLFGIWPRRKPTVSFYLSKKTRLSSGAAFFWFESHRLFSSKNARNESLLHFTLLTCVSHNDGIPVYFHYV